MIPHFAMITGKSPVLRCLSIHFCLAEEVWYDLVTTTYYVLFVGDYSNRRIFKPSKKSKLFKASKKFHSSDYFQVIVESDIRSRNFSARMAERQSFLEQYIPLNGIPKIIRTDKGTAFTQTALEL